MKTLNETFEDKEHKKLVKKKEKNMEGVYTHFNKKW